LKGYCRFLWRDKKGSVLILTFWALLLLASFALYMGAMTRQRLDLTRRTHDYTVLRMASEAGVLRLKAELMNDCGDVGSGALHEWLVYSNGFDGELRDKSRYHLTVHDEEGRLNINTAPREVLARLISDVCLVSLGEAESLADAIIDWRDADHETQPFGAEDLYYQSLPAPYEAKDDFFNSTEELLLVRGFTSKICKKLYYFVTVCGLGAVNVNTSTEPVLLSLGLSPVLVEKIFTYFKGKDGVFGLVNGKSDDLVFGWPADFALQAKEIVQILPEENQQMEDLVAQGLLNVTSRNFCAESIASGSHMGAKFVTRATYRVTPSEQGGCRIDLVWWRTGE
jgi:general secretion pathway protein K